MSNGRKSDKTARSGAQIVKLLPPFAVALVLAFGVAAGLSVEAQSPAVTFLSPTQFDTGEAFPIDLETGDFNNDGQRDVAILTNQESSKVHFLFGNGAGQLLLSPTLFTPYGTGIASGDFNGDGVLDLAVTQSSPKLSPDEYCGSSPGVVVFLGTGAAGFTFTTCLLVPGISLNDAVAADVDNDGSVDLAVGAGNGFKLYRGLGDGTFQPPINATGSSGLSVSGPMNAVDVNGDGWMDIVAEVSGTVAIFKGNGTGAFVFSLANVGSTQLSSQNGVESFALGDVNGDGFIDIVGVVRGSIANPQLIQSFVFVSLGTGAATFVPTAELHLFPDGNVGSAVMADFNKDHTLDLAVIHEGSNSVRLFLGQGAGIFTDGTSVSVGVEPVLMAAGDWNSDNWTDLAVVDRNNANQSRTWILRQQPGVGDASGPAVTLTSPAAGASVQGNVTVSANVAPPDPNGVSRLEFYRNNRLIGIDTNAPYSVIWDTTKVTNGPVTLTVRAYDTLENLSTSNGVSVTVANPDTVPPTVSLTAPASGALVTSNTLVTAVAADNQAVTKVDFFYDGTILIGSDSVAPFEATWNIAPVLAGTHTLTAKAFDVVNSTTSTPINVTIDHAPVVNAGPDQLIEVVSPVGASVTLTGSATDLDPGNELSYQWTYGDGTPLGTGVVLPLVLPLGIHDFHFAVSDGQVSVDDAVRVIVRDTTPPVVTPPVAISIAATRTEGAQGNVPTSADSTKLASFLGGATVVDQFDAFPYGFPPQAIGIGPVEAPDVDVDATTVFPVGVTTVRFMFVDSSGNFASADSAVTVTAPVGGAVTTAAVPVTAKNPQNNLAQPVTVTFNVVSQPGLLTAAVPATLPAPVPDGLTLLTPVLDIVTTALTSSPYTVCFTGVFQPLDTVMHYENGGWIGLGTTPSGGPPATFCAQTNSLSPFAVMGIRALVASADSVTVAKNSGPTVIDVLANDTGSGTLTVTGTTSAAHGTVTHTSANVSYTPAAGYSGPDTFQYTIGDGHGGAATGVVTVTVQASDPPVITIGPAGTTIASGATATLSVTATGTAPLAYQWYQGTSPNTANPIAAATASSFTTPTLTTSTSYWVHVSNTYGVADSSTATVTIGLAPGIATQPASQTIASGATANLTVVATGTAPLAFQWYQGTSGNTTTPIGGATTSSFTTPALTVATSYWVRVTNTYGTGNSNTATITIGVAPAVTTQPASQMIASGATATLSVTANGTSPLTYQWYQGNSGNTATPITGATANSFTTPALTTDTNYWVRVSNAFGAASSNTATVAIGQAPAITTQPAGQTVASGTTATLTVSATGTATLAYQWYQGSSGSTTTPVTGATTNSFTTPPITAATSYWVRVTNSYGTANSNTATISIVSSVVPSALSFGSQTLNQAAVQSVTLTNPETSPMVRRSLITGTNANQFAVSGCDTSIPAGGSCSVTVSFTPTSAGAKAASVDMFFPLSNLAVQLGSGSTNLTVTVTAGTGTQFRVNDLIKVDNEEMRVTAASANTVSVTRAANGTTRVSHAIGAEVGRSPGSAALSGTGVAVTLALSPATVNFGTVAIGASSSTIPVTVANNGAASVELTATLGTPGNNANQFALTSNCPVPPARLGSGSSCTASVRFAPTSSGSKSASLRVTPTGNTALTVALSGATPSVSMSSTAFGLVQVSQTTTLPVTATASQGPATITAFTRSTNGTSSQFTIVNGSGTCGTLPITLSQGGSCTVNVTFAPTSAGSKSATITPTVTGGGGTAGTASGTGVVVLSGAPAFGDQQLRLRSAARTFTYTNAGSGPTTPSVAIAGTNAADFSIVSNNCTSAISPGASCTFGVTFMPAALGSRTGTLTVTGSPTAQATLTGTGRQGVEFTAFTSPGTGSSLSYVSDARTLDFGNRSGTTSSTITIRNVTAGAVTLGTATVSVSTGTGGTGFSKGSDSCSLQTLAANATCSITVSLNVPTGTTNPRTATLTVPDNTTATSGVAGNGSQVLNLTGN